MGQIQAFYTCKEASCRLPEMNAGAKNQDLIIRSDCHPLVVQSLHVHVQSLTTCIHIYKQGK